MSSSCLHIHCSLIVPCASLFVFFIDIRNITDSLATSEQHAFCLNYTEIYKEGNLHVHNCTLPCRAMFGRPREKVTRNITTAISNAPNLAHKALRASKNRADNATKAALCNRIPVVVAFSSLAPSLGEGWTIQSPHARFFFFFQWKLARAH